MFAVLQLPQTPGSDKQAGILTKASHEELHFKYNIYCHQSTETQLAG